MLLRSLIEDKKEGPSRDLNPGPPAPKAGIIATRPRGHIRESTPISALYSRHLMLKLSWQSHCNSMSEMV